jgi:predicted RNA methylase
MSNNQYAYCLRLNLNNPRHAKLVKRLNSLNTKVFKTRSEFLMKAMEIADSVYSIHMACTSDYIEKTALSAGKQVTGRITYKYEIPHTFSFHNKTKKSVDVIAVSIR